MSKANITLDVGGAPMPAYVSRPVGHGPGVVVLQEIFGVTDDLRRIADLLARAGYFAIVPALFHRIDPHFSADDDDAGIEKGIAAAGRTQLDDVRADLLAAIEWLEAQPELDGGVGTWGFCYGGSIAFFSATLEEVDAAVSFYGGQIANPPAPGRPALIELAPQLRAPLFLAFGGRDPYIPLSDVDRIASALRAASAQFTLEVYDDQDHGFFRHGPESNAAAAKVWPRVRAFLDAQLRVSRPVG